MRAASSLLWGIVCAAAGCASGAGRYARVEAPGGERGWAEGQGVRARATAIALPGTPAVTEVEIEVSPAAPVRLVEARLATEGTLPCATGLVAGTIQQDDASAWARPVLVDGTRTLRLAFGGTEEILAAPSVLDLRFAGAPGACLRMPLVTADAGWRLLPSWTLGLAMRADPMAFLSARLGRWLGPVRVTAEAGLAFSSCLGPCEGAAANRQFPVALAVDAFPLRVGAWALGLEAGYEGWARFTDETSSLGHAVRGTVRLALVTPTRHLPRGPRLGAFSLDLGVRRWLTGGWFVDDRRTGAFAGVTWDRAL